MHLGKPFSKPATGTYCKKSWVRSYIWSKVCGAVLLSVPSAMLAVKVRVYVYMRQVMLQSGTTKKNVAQTKRTMYVRTGGANTSANIGQSNMLTELLFCDDVISRVMSTTN